MKPIRLFLIAALALCSAACAVIAPDKEDISAVKAAATRLPELLDANEKVYRKTLTALATSLRKHALSEAREQADFQLLFEGATTDHAGATFSPRPASPITQARIAEILGRLRQDENDAEAAVTDLEDSALNHPVHGDLKLVVDLLHNYVMARMTRDETQAMIAQQAHDLIYTKKKE